MGLPNAGKSTLFNALASRRLAETAPRPFTTIDPHEAVIPVPDFRLERLARIVTTDSRGGKPEVVPATVTFVDIAGLVKGAHKGEGLGNRFLAKIREVDAIVHVVRSFVDSHIGHQHPSHEVGSLEQVLDDIEVVNLELEIEAIKKHTIYVVNVSESQIVASEAKEFTSLVSEKYRAPSIFVSAKLEEDLIDLTESERKDYLGELGVEESGLNKLIHKSYEVLDLITFYTIKGGSEVRAWSLENSSKALEAAEKVHTDFAKGFIKAEVINVEELIDAGGWKQAKEKGKVRLEGRDYEVQNGDVIEFRVGN